MHPFFCLYGGKWRAAKHYPTPEHDTIIEPFAGAAGYSVRNYEKDVLLIDADPVISGLWDYLINASPQDILDLPDIADHETVDDLDLPQAAKWLIGFWLNKGTTAPSKRPSKWMRSRLRPNSYWGKTIRERIARQVPLIKHWRVVQGDYTQAPEIEATWFIDPPYASSGRYYKRQVESYDDLAAWCRLRSGQTIVCEQFGATWLPFRELASIKGLEGKRGGNTSREVVWTNVRPD